jgi:hypothetical protein
MIKFANHRPRKFTYGQRGERMLLGRKKKKSRQLRSTLWDVIDLVFWVAVFGSWIHWKKMTMHCTLHPPRCWSIRASPSAGFTGPTSQTLRVMLRGAGQLGGSRTRVPHRTPLRFAITRAPVRQTRRSSPFTCSLEVLQSLRLWPTRSPGTQRQMDGCDASPRPSPSRARDHVQFGTASA